MVAIVVVPAAAAASDAAAADAAAASAAADAISPRMTSITSITSRGINTISHTIARMTSADAISPTR